jgi:hypothetical protein
MSSQDSKRPADTEVDEKPTVASVAAVASTTEDLEAAEPSHPDRPVGVNVDTASLGTDSGATEDLPADEDMAEDSDEALGAAQTDAADSREA